MNLPESPVLQKAIKVWDPLVRLFHWSLVAAFTIAWLTGDEESRLHELAGYTVIGLVLIRIVWGFVGTRYARFSDFVYRPSVILSYIRELTLGKSKRHLGHNPLGGLMVLALLVSLLAAGITGLALEGAEQGTGPFASLSTGATMTMPGVIAEALADDDDKVHNNGKNENDEIWEELHEFFANLTLLLVVLHIAGVIIGSLVHRENLVRAMFTGRKPG
ncbi:MAG: cytochrome b/b6 domain-containing protein [Sulfuricaulis sp.]|uniref:cytochrome b/b6 domain-containing protein n=1 Tax=Sulfuricaulis sp. TaxID=2003553 RepID=UPI0025F5BFB1|nr:cytochrome b/b6 domain-containing protein [Sulfuricaulis sp.]MCR4346650.1 cytochrome b/b6 domain-containing protein [Sulfuricaulis sp.]